MPAGLRKKTRRIVESSVAIAMVVVVSACGGSGGGAPASSASADTASTAVVTTSTVSGAVVKGPVNGATVCAFALVPAGKGDKLGCTTSKADGSYDLQLTYAGPVLIEASGGTYTDEATGTPNVPLAETLRVVGTAGEGGSSLVPTPLTELAVRKALANGGLSGDGFKAAAAEVAAAFGITQADIAGSLPRVSGEVNAYGGALVGVSRMLSKGATLAGILGNGDLDALKKGLERANFWVCNLPAAQQLSAAPVEGVDFTVTEPQAAWRALLPSSGTAMGCSIAANTASMVKLSCPGSTVAGGVTIDIDAAAAPVSALPANGVLLVGGGVAAGDASPATGVISVGGTAVSTLAGINATLGPGPLGLSSGVTGPILSTSPGIQPQTCAISPSGAVTTAASIGTGTVSTGGTVSLGGGSIGTSGGGTPGGTISPGGGSVTTTGGATTISAGTLVIGNSTTTNGAAVTLGGTSAGFLNSALITPQSN